MSPARPFIQAAGATLALTLALTIGATWAHSAAPAAGSASLPQKKEDSSLTVLTPEVAKKLTEFLDKVKAGRMKKSGERMTQEIDDVAKATGLGDDGRKALEAPARQAAAAGLDESMAKWDDRMRKQFAAQPPEQSLAILNQEIPQAGSVVGVDWSGDVVQPFEREDWIKALHQVLSPDQLAAWDAAQAARRDSIEKEVGAKIKSGATRIHDQQTQVILAQCHEIEASVALPKDRADKLEALGRSVVDTATDLWRKRMLRVFLSMDDDQRKIYTRNENIFVGINESESPTKQAAWQDGVAAILTADETAKIKAISEARRARRVHAMGEALIMLLDEKIAFTEGQRQKLQVIAERLISDQAQQFAEPAAQGFYGVSATMFYTAAGKVDDGELRPILDDIQREHWRQVATLQDPAARPRVEPPAQSGESEPEDVEKCISNFLYEKTLNERNRALAANELKAEDVTRVAGLKADAATQLKVAARGTTEDYLASWKLMTEQQIRSQLQGLTPQNVRQRLDSLQDFFVQRNFGLQNGPDRPSIWENTLKVELSAPQQESWKKETDARAAYRDQAIADLVVAEFDRKNRITEDQWAKLEPKIAGVVHDFTTDISRVFGGFNGMPWYLGGGYTLMPFAGVPADDLKAILSKGQYDEWSTSQDCANGTNLWQMVKQIHNQKAQAQARMNRG